MNYAPDVSALQHFLDPRETVRLLDELTSSGFDDRAFALLHHFGEKEKIQSHRFYCENRVVESFRIGTNALVQQRLALVAAMHKAGRFSHGGSGHFQSLAAAVVQFLPHEE